MKALVTYMSNTGNTRKVAEAIFGEINDQKDLRPIDEVESIEGYDISFLGFPIHQMGPDKKTAKLIEKHCINNRNVVLFITHAAPEDAPDLQPMLEKFRAAARGANIIDMFDCRGELSKSVKRIMSIMPNAKLRRWAKEDDSQGQPDNTRIERAREFSRNTMRKFHENYTGAENDRKTPVIEYFHASKYGNGARVAEEFKRQMTEKGVTVNVHHVRETRPQSIPEADLYLFSSPGRMGKPIGDMRSFLKNAQLPYGAKYAILNTEGAPKPDKNGRIPDEEETGKYQRVIPIMNEMLQEKGLVKAAEGKIYVTGMKGPLEEDWQEKVEAFTCVIPVSSEEFEEEIVDDSPVMAAA